MGKKISKKKTPFREKKKSLADKQSTNLNYVEILTVALILIGAFVIRYIYLTQVITNDSMFPHLEGTDMGAYDMMAQQILNHTFPKSPYSYNPLYYYFLAGVYLFTGANPISAAHVQFMISCFTYLFVYLIARRIFNRQIATIALIICALYGIFIIHESLLLSVVLDTLFLPLAVFVTLFAQKKGDWGWYLLLGIILGLAAMSRPNIILISPFFLLWILFMNGLTMAMIKKLLLVGIAAIVIISPVTIRNYCYSHKFILLTTSGPAAFWAGNNELSDGTANIPPGAIDDLLERYKNEKNPYMADIKNFMKINPLKFIQLQLKKIGLFWAGNELPDNDIVYERFSRHAPILKSPIILTFGIVGPLALLGFLLSFRRFSKMMLLLYIVIFGFMISIVAFFVQSRYRLPIVSLLSIFAALAVWEIYIRLKTKHLISIVWLVMLFLIFYAGVNFHKCFNWAYPVFLPHGFLTRTPTGYVIHDDSGEWHGDRAVTTISPEQIIRKDIYIEGVELDKLSDAGISMMYAANNKGYITITINGVPLPQNIPCERITYNQFFRTVRFGIDPKRLKNGMNTINIRAYSGGSLQVPIDNYYKYHRSYYSQDGGNHWTSQDGEYIIKLELILYKYGVIERRPKVSTPISFKPLNPVTNYSYDIPKQNRVCNIS